MERSGGDKRAPQERFSHPGAVDPVPGLFWGFWGGFGVTVVLG